MLAEFRQDFKKSNLIIDTSYTQGFRKEEEKNLKDQEHIFSQNYFTI